MFQNSKTFLTLSFPLAFSFGGHFVLFLLFIGVSFSFLGDWFSARKEIQINMKETIRVDLVGMPDLSLEELKKLPKLSKPKNSALKPRRNQVLKARQNKAKTSASSKQFDSFLDNMAKKKTKLKVKNKVEEPTQRKGNTKLDDLVIKGNILSKGTSVTGEVNAEDLTELQRYSLEVRDKVKVNWVLPPSLLEQNLRASVRVFIKQDGTLSSLRIVKDSGVEEYNRRVLDIVRQSAPFPSVSDEILDDVNGGSIVLNFPFAEKPENSE